MKKPNKYQTSGVIEQIEINCYMIRNFIRKLKKQKPILVDQLDISNGRGIGLGVLQIFNLHYRQLGTFKVKRPHNFKENQEVQIFIKNGKIVHVIPMDHSYPLKTSKDDRYCQYPVLEESK